MDLHKPCLAFFYHSIQVCSKFFSASQLVPSLPIFLCKNLFSTFGRFYEIQQALSPTLVNIYMSDIPLPKNNSVNIIVYADDITITSSHSNTNKAIPNLLPYLYEIHTWAHNNNLQINSTKTTTTLMTLDPSEYNKPLNIHINNTLIPITSNPTILGLLFDPKLNFSTHTNNAITKKTLNLLKLLTSTHWGKIKETLITTYKTLLLAIIEYANTIWSPITSSTSLNKLQKIQTAALRKITACAQNTNNQHPT